MHVSYSGDAFHEKLARDEKMKTVKSWIFYNKTTITTLQANYVWTTIFCCAIKKLSPATV